MAKTPVNGSESGRSVVSRVSAVLTALIDSGPDGTSASEIARRIGLPVPTAHRLLAEMGQTGLTMRQPNTKRWTLGPMALGLGATARQHLTLLDLARPSLQRITERTGETTVLAVRDGLHATYVDFVQGPQRLTLGEHVGMRLPLVVGASRQVILAHLPEAEREEVLAALHTAGHLPDVAAMLRHCAMIRERGYAMTRGAITPGASGIAAPVRERTGAVLGSLMLAIPDVRCPETAVPGFAAVLVEEAADLSRLTRPTSGS